jgi:hypothetical protein
LCRLFRLERGSSAGGLVVLAGHEPQKPCNAVKLGRGDACGSDGFEEHRFAHGAIFVAGLGTEGRGFDTFLFADAAFAHEARFDELADRVVDGVGIFDVEHEADIGQPFGAGAVADRVQDQHFERRKAGVTCSGHSADDPTVEGVTCNDKAKLKL